MPTPAVLPTPVSPLAVVVTSVRCCALTSIVRVAVMPGPCVMVATDDVFATETAMDGVTVTLPPAAPASDSVVNASVTSAEMIRSRAPVTGGPRLGSATGSKPANASSFTRLSEIEAPMPTVPEPLCADFALLVLELLDEAAMARSPTPVTLPPPSGAGRGAGRLDGRHGLDVGDVERE